jgi:multidrug resistance protein, MATE family
MSHPVNNSPSRSTHPYEVEIPTNIGFKKTTRRSSLVSGSIGRQGFIDGLRSSSFHDEEEILGYGDVITVSEGTTLAQEEQSLLNDNHIRAVTSYGAHTTTDEREISSSTESRIDEIVLISKSWDAAVREGKISTSARRELKVLSQNSAPLVVTFLLQYSLVVASILSVGHLGKTELAAVTLATMTASITGFALIQGLATCLDTLCPQAYGAGNFRMVGLYFQKCVLMILVCFAPVAILWLFSDRLLVYVIPDEELAKLAGEYLKLVVWGTPGYILFECGKRFVQAQGIFHASTMVLLIASPVNVFLNYFLVWNEAVNLGYHGAAIAVATTDWLMAILLFLYVAFIDGKDCWFGLSKEMFSDWFGMLRLAIPGVIMVEAEFLAFELLTFAASYLGTTALAVQSVLSTIVSLVYQIPFAVSIAASTRIANFVGATLADSAKLTTIVSIGTSYSIAIFNGIILLLLRYRVGALFSSDEDVIRLVGQVIPLCAFMQVFDATSGVGGGILRGQGRQFIGGYLNLFFYYVVALPLGLFLAFKMDLEIYGLWTGLVVGIACISLGQQYFVFKADWDQIVEDASNRNRREIVTSQGHS